MTISILDSLKKIKILVIGDVMLDRYWWGNVNRISPEAPVPIVNLDKASLVAGGAANVAMNLIGLGITPYLFGIVGDDAEANLLGEHLKANGISDDFLTKVPSRPTTIKTRIVAHSQHVVRIDHETIEPINKEIAAGLLDEFNAVLPEVDAVIISDYAKGLLTDFLLDQLGNSIQSAGKPLFVDPKRRDFSVYKGATAITPNKHEAADASGLTFDTRTDIENAGKSLRSQMRLDALLITEGENGMTLFDGSDTGHHFEPLAQNVFDVTGAGDTVIATFAAAAAAGHSCIEAARLANIAAGLVVQRIGTTPINATMLEEFFAGTSDT